MSLDKCKGVTLLSTEVELSTEYLLSELACATKS